MLLPGFDDMMPGFDDPYCLLWQRLHSPLTAFGSLWGEVVIRGKTLEQSKEHFTALEYLPPYLGRFSARNALAAKMESITARFVQHARSMLDSQSK